MNKLTADNFGRRLKQANLARKDDIADFVKKTYFDDKLKFSIKMLLQIKQNINWFEMNQKSTNIWFKFFYQSKLLW